jgi:cell surface protein SprA
MDPSGNLTNPASRWGGIMRAIDQTDFETSNVQYIEFWMQSPFLTGNNNGTGGQLYMDLGSISEDVLKDGRKLFENGLNTPNIPAAIDNSSVWGRYHSTQYKQRMHLVMILQTGLTRIRVLTE